MKRQRHTYLIRWIVLFSMLSLPLILIYLPKTYFDHGPTICIFTLITGKNCFGCGLTRAGMRLIHLDFAGAWQYNKMSFFVFGGLIILYLRFLALNLKILILTRWRF